MPLQTLVKVNILQSGGVCTTVPLLYDNHLRTYYWEKSISYGPTGFSTEELAIAEAVDIGLAPYVELVDSEESAFVD